MRRDDDTVVRWSSLIALGGVCVFAGVCAIAQFYREDLDWWDAPLSFYLVGNGGMAVQVAYLALSIGLVALGIGTYYGLARGGRSGAAPLLFALGGVALAVTALAHTDTHGQLPSLHGFVHLVAAASAFLCVTVAMLLQSWRFRSDSSWRDVFAPAMGLALLAFADLWLYALTRFAPRGAMQKSVIALILLWLAGASMALYRRSRR